MTKLRAKANIAKPVIDTKAAIAFVSAQHKSSAADSTPARTESGSPAPTETPAGFVRLDVPVKVELYGRLEAEARRKGKTVAEMVGKLIQKHISKH